MRKFLTYPLIALLVSAFSIAAQSTASERPIDVPDINGMAVTLVKPAFPETAVAADADGEAVTLKVVVDENGNVVTAACSTTCHAMLKDAAELAALQSKFKPLIKDGRAVRYQGILIYTFVVNRVNWFRFATALESTRQFDNLSLGPVAQILPPDRQDEKTKLISLDAEGVTFETRQKVIAEVANSVRSKLTGRDLWHYDLAMALRRITFWTQAAEATDRGQLQKAIAALASNASAAPEDAPAELISDLTVISKYRIPDAIAERDLRRAIMELTRKAMMHFAEKRPASLVR